MSLLTDLFTDYTVRTVALGSAALGLVAGALGTFAVLRRQSLLAFGAPVEVNIYGYNLADLQRMADEAVREGLVELDMSLGYRPPVNVVAEEMAESAEQMDIAELKVAAAKSSGVVLTAGIVAWAMRGGALLSSLMSTIPLWKGYDPLPILAYEDDDEEDAKEKDLDEDSIPTSLEELKRLKELKAKAVNIERMFGDTVIRE